MEVKVQKETDLTNLVRQLLEVTTKKLITNLVLIVVVRKAEIHKSNSVIYNLIRSLTHQLVEV